MEQRENWIGPYIPQGNKIRELVQQLRLAYNLVLDARVHPVTKLIPLAALGYVLLPVDVAPDVVPLLGQVDDVAVLLFGLRLFFEFSPAAVVHEHLKKLVQTIRSDWTVVEDTGPATGSAATGQAAAGEVYDENEG